jgi:hypothetical protein
MNNFTTLSRLNFIGRRHPVYQAMHLLSKSLRVSYYKIKKRLYWDNQNSTINILDEENQFFDIGMYDFKTKKLILWGFKNCNCLKFV